MRRNQLNLAAASVVYFGLSLLASSAHALDPSFTAPFREQVVKQVCSDGGKWLSCYQMPTSSCTSIAGSLVATCSSEVFGAVQGVLDEQGGFALATKFQECFNQKFADKYSALKVKSAECDAPPQHLQDKK